VSHESLVVLHAPRVEALFEKRQFVADRAVTREVLAALPRGEVIRREVAEGQASLRQAVAYTTLRCGDGLLCLRRSKDVKGELKGRWTVVFGGHVNADERDGLNGLRRCVARELREEFGRIGVRALRFKGVVADPTSEVGKRHLGFMFEAEVRASTVRLDRRFDNHEYLPIRGREFFSEIDRLLGADRRRFDPWSQLVLSAYDSLSSLSEEAAGCQEK